MHAWNAKPAYSECNSFSPTHARANRSQEDMSRTEDLTTKLRTLSYDHERLKSMHKTETEKAANAEREMNHHKSRAK